jgi:hypothetical protein
MNPPSLNVDLESVKLAGSAEVLHRPGAVRLDEFPGLVFAPAQHGPGIRTEDSGASVEAICMAAAVATEQGQDLDAIADRFRTSPEYVRQAIEYGSRIGFTTHE